MGVSFMEIVVLDGYALNPGDLSWESFEKMGKITVYDRTPYEQDEIIRRIGDCELVFTNKTPITRETMLACPKMKFINVLATGYNVVDTESAHELGIVVSNIPGYGTASVSQFTIGLLLELCHHIGLHTEAVRDGAWECAKDFCFWNTPQMELDGKTMGIIGFGMIGKQVGKIASALGMKILANSPHPDEEGMKIAEYVDLDTLLANSDVIALHCKLTKENEGFINRESIAKMKDGVILLNSARGQLLNEQDVADALNAGKIAGLGADTVAKEPASGSNPLLTAKNCLITPHMAWASKEARQRIMDMAMENLNGYLEGKPVHSV